MYLEFFARSPLLALPLVALLLFIVVFGAVVVRTCGRWGREMTAAAEKLPLE